MEYTWSTHGHALCQLQVYANMMYIFYNNIIMISIFNS